jgi:hypothetical protein
MSQSLRSIQTSVLSFDCMAVGFSSKTKKILRGCPKTKQHSLRRSPHIRGDIRRWRNASRCAVPLRAGLGSSPGHSPRTLCAACPTPCSPCTTEMLRVRRAGVQGAEGRFRSPGRDAPNAAIF